MEKNRSVTLFAVGIGIGIVLMIFLLDSIGLDRILDSLSTAKIEYVLLALSITTIALVLRGIRRFTFLRRIDKTACFKTNFTVLLSGAFFENVSPGRIGEFFVPLAFVNQNQAIASGTLSSIVVERVLDLLISLAISLLGLSLFNFQPNVQFPLILGMLLMIVAAAVILFVPRILGGFFSWLSRLLSKLKIRSLETYEEKLQKITSGAGTNVRFLFVSKKTATAGIALTIVMWILNGARFMFVMKSLGIDLPLLQSTVVVVFTILFALVSMIPFGQGVAELTTVFILTSIGVQSDIAISAAIIDRLLAVWFPLLIGLGASLKLRKMAKPIVPPENVGVKAL